MGGARACNAGQGSDWAADDVSAVAELLDQGAFRAEHVVAILGKTEATAP